jgi:hypothetical protein
MSRAPRRRGREREHGRRRVQDIHAPALGGEAEGERARAPADIERAQLPVAPARGEVLPDEFKKVEPGEVEAQSALGRL